MRKNNERQLLKRISFWFLLTIAGAIIGSFVTFAGSHYIYPIWANIASYVTGKRCCFKSRDPIPVEIFAKQMTKLIETGYVISLSPQAAKVKIAPGVYECQRSYLEVTKHVLDRNSGNLSYGIDHRKKVIHLILKTQP